MEHSGNPVFNGLIFLRRINFVYRWIWTMFDKLTGVENRFLAVENLLSDPAIVQDLEAYQKYSREHSDLKKIVFVFRKYKKTLSELDDSMELLKDKDSYNFV